MEKITLNWEYCRYISKVITFFVWSACSSNDYIGNNEYIEIISMNNKINFQTGFPGWNKKKAFSRWNPLSMNCSDPLLCAVKRFWFSDGGRYIIKGTVGQTGSRRIEPHSEDGQLLMHELPLCAGTLKWCQTWNNFIPARRSALHAEEGKLVSVFRVLLDDTQESEAALTKRTYVRIRTHRPEMHEKRSFVSSVDVNTRFLTACMCHLPLSSPSATSQGHSWSHLLHARSLQWGVKQRERYGYCFARRPGPRSGLYTGF